MWAGRGGRDVRSIATSSVIAPFKVVGWSGTGADAEAWRELQLT